MDGAHQRDRIIGNGVPLAPLAEVLNFLLAHPPRLVHDEGHLRFARLHLIRNLNQIRVAFPVAATMQMKDDCTRATDEFK